MRDDDGAAMGLLDGLTEQWQASLDERAAMHPRSAVGSLDELLKNFR
ncbi:hypothetical protein [Streptomyces sp. NPDC127084]